MSERSPYEILAWEAVEILEMRGYHITVSQFTKEKIIRVLADHFKDAAESWLVPEGFCADCEYRRRCEQ